MATFLLTDEQIKLLSPQLLQMELGGEKMTQPEMATALGLTVHKLKTLRASEHYQAMIHDAERKQRGMAERTLKNQTLAIRDRLNTYTETAVETLYELMTTSRDGKVRLGAACEILDRDGRFAKVSRLMNVQQGQDGAPMLPEDAAAEILEALAKAKTSSVVN